MDEPFGALDTHTRLKMQDFLINVWEKVQPTIVLVTHDISEAVYLADDIYIMSNAPAKFIEHIDVNLPYKRTREIKRDPGFVQLVQYIEDNSFSMGKVMNALRLSIVGAGKGPDLFSIIELLGKIEVAKRIDFAIENIHR